MKHSILIALCLFVCPAWGGDANWKSQLKTELPRMGHRNWIVIVDSAYPLQSGQGIETITAAEPQLEVIQEILNQLANARHVRPVVHLDAELPFVPESEARGISAYKEGLNAILKKHQPISLPHEKIIEKLDNAGKTFKVLVIKTPLTLPYTSVFLELDCGYWGPQSEKKLREAMMKKGDKNPSSR